MTPKQTQYVAVTTIMGIIAALLVWFVVISPQWGSGDANAAAASVANAQASNLQGQAVALQGKQRQLPQMESSYKQLLAQFPPEFDAQGWMQQLLGAASASGVTIKSVAPANPVPGIGTGGLTKAPANQTAATPTPGAATTSFIGSSTIIISADGPIGSLQRFMTAIENLKQPMLVDSFSINGTTLSVTGRTFMLAGLPNPTGVPGADQVTPTQAPSATPTTKSTPTGGATTKAKPSASASPSSTPSK